MSTTTSLPTVVIGAGPVGLTAAAHLVRRGITPLVLEAADRAGNSLRDWAHVRLFSPWEYSVDPVAADLLNANGWTAPPNDAFPTGGELAEHYVEPLAALPALRGRIRYGTQVVAVTRRGIDKLKDAGRETAPLEVVVKTARGHERLLAGAVIDASGTWQNPNPLGSGGVPAEGERDNAARIAYRIPDVLTRDRDRYAGRRVVVLGTGHSAFNVIVDLAELRRSEPSTEIVWAIRRPRLGDTLEPGANDPLPERGAIGGLVGRLIDEGAIELITDFHTLAVDRRDDHVVLRDGDREIEAREVIATTGFRPDLSILSELRLDLDDRVEAPRRLAPLIDPNLHSCGSVPPHGIDELRHPDDGVFVVGMKSYGRAPTFLLRTGYEQVRSVVAALAGDWTAARRIELVLPDGDGIGKACCAPQRVEQVGASSRAAAARMPTGTNCVDLVIVGAGQSGLAAAFEARRVRLSAIVLEASNTPAGSWPHYYDSLTLFSPAKYSSLPGAAFPGDPDRYPTRDDVVAYLSGYAEQFGDAIRLGKRVDTVAALPDGGFTVTTASGDQFQTSAVIAASGQFGAPHRPDLPGLERFDGTVLHAADYRGPSRFVDQRVIVVGAGNSAIQIAAELAQTARTTLATREPVRWLPQRPFGRDIHWWLRTTRFDIAPLTGWLARVPVSVIDDGTYRAAVIADRPDRRPMFDRLDGDDVVWSDGRREPVDAVILATGYRPHVHYLDGTGALDPDGSPLHRRGLSTTVPGLGYVGLEFQRSFSSNTLRGCGRDARFVVNALRPMASNRPVAVPA